MLASNRLPVLGGETRDVTVFFSDLAGFSSIAEKMTPAELVAFMNEYLSAMTEDQQFTSNIVSLEGLVELLAVGNHDDQIINGMSQKGRWCFIRDLFLV